MGFTSISVREAMERINATNNGWYLPAVQRQYVWGSRSESEKYICRLFDSILRGYPIGTLIVWNNDQEIRYRPFMSDYIDGDRAEFADENMWGREDKWLVYDGQQRLQTLYSCLTASLNKRVLAYNLFFDLNSTEDAETTGFHFIDKDTRPAPGCISVPELYSHTDDGNGQEKVNYRKKQLKKLSDDERNVYEAKVEVSVDRLWSVFIQKDKKSLAYFPIEKSWSEDRVNDVFQRLNAGGVPLSGSDLLFSKIKAIDSYFEENVEAVSEKIKQQTQGYVFESDVILQLLHLIVKREIKINPDRIKNDEAKEFPKKLPNLETALEDFFTGFVWGCFKIDNRSIIQRQRALLPLIAYVYKRGLNGTRFSHMEADNIKKMKQYFILSQANNWNTEGMIQQSSILSLNAEIDFPIDEIRILAESSKRVVGLTSKSLEEEGRFILKVLLPQQTFSVSSESVRYRPQLDHIFPLKLKNRPEVYEVDVLWNLQPFAGVHNNIKRTQHPKTYFENNPDALTQYSFVPQDLSSPLWNDHVAFINERKKKMLEFLCDEYGLEVMSDSEG